MSDPPREAERYELRAGAAWRVELGRREFLGAAGQGLLLSVFAAPAAGQRGAGADTLEARLHIGEDGFVTVLAGKVEEGQGPRAELAMAAAEELRLPCERVRVVLADTDVAPNDGITAGSRTTPSTVPAVRQAAATVRHLLARLDADAAARADYAVLARSPELKQAYGKALPPDAALTAAGDWKILGKPGRRPNGRDLVTGSHAFPSDVRRPEMWYGAVLRPPAFGATLERVDGEAGRKTGALVVQDGDFVACAAPTSYAARKAIRALEATASWRRKPQPSSRELFDHLKLHATSRPARVQQKGAVEPALAQAARRVRATFQTAYVQHAPMEPRAAVAEWKDGRLTVWTGTSHPFAVRDQLARFFALAPEHVRVMVPDMGGGFGGKHTGEAALEAARLAREAGRPVSVRWTRAEEFQWAYFRPAALIEVEAGLDANHQIVAWDFANYNSGASAIEAPYRIPNTRTRFLECEAPLRQGSYRCLAATANNFARETFLDELAGGADPLEYRLAHLDNQRLRDVLLAAAKAFRWQERRKQRRPGVGIGMALGTEKNSVVAACAAAECDRASGEPRLLEIVEAFECGAILNPANLRQQVEGCILMGLGAALREEIRFENGHVTNGTFAQYRVPRFRDVPRIEVVLLDRRDLEPAGAGETPIIAVAPALANALFDLTGTRVRSLPLRVAPAQA